MGKQQRNKVFFHGSQLTLVLCILLGSDLKGCDEVIILDPAFRITPTPTATPTTTATSTATTTTSVSTSSTSTTSSTTTTVATTADESTEELRIFNAFGSNEELDSEDSDDDKDSDLDALSDEDEAEAKTSRTNPDSDGDGWTDGAEVTQGFDPKNPASHPPIDQARSRSKAPLNDLDNDGLPDILEKELHSNLNNPDSDGDDQMDGLELLNGTNPNDENSKTIADTDQDGLSDQLEQQFKTNPQNPDTDNDRLIDSLELLYNLDPKNPDTNGDGIIDSAQPGAKDFRFTNKEFHF